MPEITVNPPAAWLQSTATMPAAAGMQKEQERQQQQQRQIKPQGLLHIIRSLKAHKHEIVEFFWPKLKPYMTLVNIHKF
jgi:hypothetical protein